MSENVIKLASQNHSAEVQRPDEHVPRSVEGWVPRIRPHLAKAAESIVAAGKELLEAKAALDHGKFGDLLEELGIKDRTAQRLMQVARQPALGNPSHATHLPADYTTLAVLAQLPEDVIAKEIDAGEITPSLSRADAKLLVEMHTQPQRSEPNPFCGEDDEVGVRSAHIDDVLRQNEPGPVDLTEDELAALRAERHSRSRAWHATRERNRAVERVAKLRSRLSDIAEEYGVDVGELRALVPEEIGQDEGTDVLLRICNDLALSIARKLPQDRLVELAAEKIGWNLW